MPDRPGRVQGARRRQLVLVDRAFGLLDVAQKRGIRPDRDLWTALIQCAGFSGQLSRAYRVLSDMTRSGARPNSWTFTVLISACVLVRSRVRSVPLSALQRAWALHTRAVMYAPLLSCERA